MKFLESLVEERIAKAQERGELNDLPGAGEPLELDDNRLVPEELRVAYRVLKNAGHVPPEVEALRDIRDLERALTREEAAGERTHRLARMNALLMRARIAVAAVSKSNSEALSRFEQLRRHPTCNSHIEGVTKSDCLNADRRLCPTRHSAVKCSS